MKNVLEYVDRRRLQFVRELSEFVRFRSVSANLSCAGDVDRCAIWLAQQLSAIGLQNILVLPTARHPIVYADWLHSAATPTLLIYGHYDVQPPDPLDEWHTPPFQPTIRSENLYARGASDDKGQMFVHIKAIESFLRTTGRLPVNVKCLFEGEEEIGSPHLPRFLENNKERLHADVAVVSDMRMLGPDRPAITESLRGGLSVELEVQALRQDLHSGNFGGAVHNPLQALCEMIAQLHDSRGKVAIPGFYDRVRDLSREERHYMARVGPIDRQILADAGAERGWGETGYSLYERTTVRPALTINGISGGYRGPGVKAVIPARASAKLNFRLVCDQDPTEIDEMFRKFIGRITPQAVTTRVRTLLKAYPVSVSRRHPAINAAAAAYRHGFRAEPVFLRVGGTIPVVHLLQSILRVPTVLMGFALPDDNLHAPNEKLHLPTFFRGIRTSIYFFTELAKLPAADSRQSADGFLCLPSQRGPNKALFA